MSEKASSNNIVSWTVKLEEKQFSRLQCSEQTGARRLPKIYLFKTWVLP
jgi:hypothetical protein